MRRVFLAGVILAALLNPRSVLAQTGTVAPVPRPVFTNATGAICGSCKLYTYAAGTTTPLATYQDVTLSTAHSNPITLNAGGKPPANIYLSANSYKFVLKTSADVTIDTADNVSAVHASVTGVSNTGDLTFQVDTDSNGSNVFNFLNGTGVTKATINESGDLQIDGTLTIGDATEADKALLFDGNTQDYHIGVDDSADTLVIGRGTALGTTPAITITTAGVTTLAGATTITGAATLSSTLAVTGATTVGDLRGTTETITATGTVNDQALGATTTILRLNNATLLTLTGFTGGTAGRLLIVESVGAGDVVFSHQTGSTATNQLLNFATSGGTPLEAGSGMAMFVYDGTSTRWRLVRHEQGAWISPAFAAGDYTGAGAMTVTVASGDVSTYAYRLNGTTLTVATYVNTATIGGTPSTSVQVKIPGGFTATKTMSTACWISDNGTKRMGIVSAASSGTNLLIAQAPDDGATWAAAADTSYWRATISFEVN